VPGPARSAASPRPCRRGPRPRRTCRLRRALESELRNNHRAIGRLNSVKGASVRTGDREAHGDIVAVDNEMPYLPMPIRDVVDLDGRCINDAIRSKSRSLQHSRQRQVQGPVFVALRHRCVPATSRGQLACLSGVSTVRTRVTNTSNASMKSRKNCSVPLSVTSPASVIKPGVNWM
jgi:hypothetical protein